jgi:phosphopantothenoylcysteine decarboxylase/phosphopantothenate--cysteine ligase
VARNLRIILGVTGGIAAYKTPSLIRLFQKKDVEVKVVCTNAAQTLVAQQTLCTISGHTVYTDDPVVALDMAHLSLAAWADFLLVCPATANSIAKIAHGVADNLLTSLALSFEHRMVIAPAMNTAMWLNAATRENIELLIRRGACVLPVDEGDLACGDAGPGRLLSLETIVDFMLSLNSVKRLAHKKILISSGPTREPIDAVRFISNRSSGKMGAALARAAWIAGGRVTVVSGPAATPLPGEVRVINVSTAGEMLFAMEKEFAEADICIMAAAVSDFKTAQPFAGKMHRGAEAALNLELVANPDIAALLGERKKNQFLVCFSLETDDDETRVLEKMNRKRCDMMVVNRADVSLDSDATQLRIMYPGAPTERLLPQSKKEAATDIIERIAARMDVIRG